VPCGKKKHTLRWEAGTLRLLSHPDAEAELVLAALGGEKPGCVTLAEAWGRHSDDLSVLSIWPRSTDDRISVTWDDVSDPQFASQGQLPRRAALQDVEDRAAQRRTDLLSLLALGAGFQLRLSGHVADAHAATPSPAMMTALTGRLALATRKWIGIHPDRVKVTLHDGEDWGTSCMSGIDAERELTFTLPASWLASVWACGLALVGGHLVVAVTEPGWPNARVLALPAPGTDPVPLDVRGSADRHDNPVWKRRSTQRG
jgi:hypothetical protein